MPKVQTIKGVLKTLAWMTAEDFREMDHKLPRIVFGVVTFAAMAFFYLYFFRSILHV